MASKSGFQRFASPNEQRTISREDVGLYHAVITGAVYEFDENVDVRDPSTFYGPLRHCISEQPYMSVTLEDMHTDKAFYRLAPTIDLKDHIKIITDQAADDPMTHVQRVLQQSVDAPFPRGIPPWKILVLPLRGGCFIAFCFSHAIGDGPTGTAFHHAFLHGCRANAGNEKPASQEVKVPARLLPPPFDTSERLPISWKFLLLPLLALILPRFISERLGLRASAASNTEGTWTGSKCFYDPSTSRSRLILREIDALVLSGALSMARKHDAKLTGAFQEIIARALSRVITDVNITEFVSQTATNMRPSIGLSSSEGGNYISGCYVTYPRQDPVDSFSDANWAAARSYTQRLAASAATLQDQAVGLLRFVPSVRSWMLSKIGQERDCSFEMSNIGSFNDQRAGDSGHAGVRITKMVFTQPGHIVGATLAFNLVSVKGGALVYTVTWQAGALGLGEDSEESFVGQICASIDDDLRSMAS